jgi:anti-sigma factor RsiW
LDEKELEGGRFFMKHYNYDEWLQYVKNEVNKKTRLELENHLYTCDECLDHYLQAMAANESSLPILANESTFTDMVMAEVAKKKDMVPDTVRNLNTMSMVSSVPDTQPLPIKLAKVSKQPNNQPKGNDKKSFYQQAGFHYLLAAAATMVLMFSGAFQSLATYANAIESPQFQEKETSVTEGVINKTFAWMDSLEKKEANKK